MARTITLIANLTRRDLYLFTGNVLTTAINRPELPQTHCYTRSPRRRDRARKMVPTPMSPRGGKRYACC